MVKCTLSDADFETEVRYSAKAAKSEAIVANDAFVAAMNAAIKRRREKAVPGTYIDNSPPIGAKRLRGTAPMSACGSPAAMCMDAGSHHGGAETLK